MTHAKQQLLLSSSCLLVAGDRQIETTLQHLVSAGVGKILVIGKSSSPCRTTDAIASCFDDVAIEFYEFEHHELPEPLLQDVKLVVEASLDWQFKLRLSDLCMRIRTPLIHSGVSGLRFQLFTMLPGKSACLRCALPSAGIDDVPLTPVAITTIAPVATCLGSLMALEAIKVLAKLGVTQGNELWKVDGLSGEIEIVRGLDPRLDCPDCGRA